jgi:peptide/nickel transport system substrate-binding protein
MKRLRWQLIIIFLTGLVVGFLLLGEQPSQQLIALEPAKGGIYAEALVGSLQRLNPVLDFYNSVDRDVNSLLYSGLIRFDDRGLPKADLAESWGISMDGTIYNFTLRPNIRWHDGEPLTSKDVMFTIELLREGGDIVPKDMQTFWQQVEVKDLSDNTLQFKLPEAYSPFLDFLDFGILPEHILANLPFGEIVNSQFNLQPIGSGPYKFDRLIVENDQITGVVLSVFEDYYGKKPYIDQVVFRYYPDGASAFKAYQDGLVQGIGQVSLDILTPVLTEANLNLYTVRRPELSLIILNLKNPQATFFQDVNVRRALMTGLNRQWIVDNLLQSQAVVAEGPITPGSWAYYDNLEKVGFDLEAAKNILKESGYIVSADGSSVRQKEGTALSFVLSYPDTENHKALAEAIQKDWQLLDVQVDLESVPYEELVNIRLQDRDFQAALVDINQAHSPDPDPYPFWDQSQATGGQNYSQWDNRTASEYLETARVTLDFEERSRLYRNFQVVFSEELPSLPLYYPLYNYAVDQELQGVRVGPLFESSDRFLTFSDWYLISKLPSINLPPAEEQ